jgi:hypothetical protein
MAGTITGKKNCATIRTIITIVRMSIIFSYLVMKKILQKSLIVLRQIRYLSSIYVLSGARWEPLKGPHFLPATAHFRALRRAARGYGGSRAVLSTGPHLWENMMRNRTSREGRGNG